MKLIIREYLASLRERGELDVLLPDLLSQMGLDVFSKPGIGTTQYGVDVAAFGKIKGDKEEKVYLFSIKAGDIRRSDWNGKADQALRPSLESILDSYINSHVMEKYKTSPIEICICFGGIIKEPVRLAISQYQEKETTERISFSEWGGEKIAGYIENYFLKEELLPKKFHRLLRKSLAMLDEPAVSVNHYRELIKSLSTKQYEENKDRLTAVRQIYICMWILYTWCREADNVESAFQASEISVLHAWQLLKPQLGEKDKNSKSIQATVGAIIALNINIQFYFLEQKVIPHTGNLFALSNASRQSRPFCHLDTNLKLFDILGRLALGGIWLIWDVQRLESGKKDDNKIDDNIESLHRRIDQYTNAIKRLINNNPVLDCPCKDSQAIDIALAVLFLAAIPTNRPFLNDWLSEITYGSRDLLYSNGYYPCTLNSYHELLEHPKHEDGYKEQVTQGSILYPYLAAFAALFSFDDIYKQIQELKKEQLPHCNFQLWYPDETSEEQYYLNTGINGERSCHGTTLCNVPVDENQKSFLDLIFKECKSFDAHEKLSVFKQNLDPIILMASRHYRLPVPIQFFKDFWHEDS